MKLEKELFNGKLTPKKIFIENHGIKAIRNI